MKDIDLYTIDRAMTAQEKQALRQYWQDLAEIEAHNFEQPVFGRYEPDLFPDARLDADLDPFFPLRPYNRSSASIQPDAFYYEAQGVEVPTRGYQGGRWSFKAVLCWCLFWVAVAEVVLLVAGY